MVHQTNLEEQSKHNDHGNTGYDVCVILNNKLMTEDRRVFRRSRSPLDCHLV